LELLRKLLQILGSPFVLEHLINGNLLFGARDPVLLRKLAVIKEARPAHGLARLVVLNPIGSRETADETGLDITHGSCPFVDKSRVTATTDIVKRFCKNLWAFLKADRKM